MRITFDTAVNKEEKTAFICIRVNGEPIWFHHTCQSYAEALLLEGTVGDAHAEQTKAIKKAAYELGKKAARNPKYKVSEFYGCFTDNDVGYQ